MRRRYLALVCTTALVGISCTHATAQQSTAATPRTGHPGFDTRRYPGDAALRTWRASSPYEWTAYYLVAPCQTGSSWSGKRTIVHDIGYGTAVVFLGEQDWPAGSGHDTTAVRRDSTPAPVATPQPKQCTTANLTTAKGEIDAARADSTASAEGFPGGTVVYLDIERVETVSAQFEQYIRAWTRGMLRSGRFLPGIYVHEKNADAVHAIIASEYARAGRKKIAPFWVAARGSGTAFDVALAPLASGFAYATIWQGLYNTAETWGGVTLTIDANVASSADPSGGR